MNAGLRVIAVAVVVAFSGALLVLLQAREKNEILLLTAAQAMPVQYARPLREPPITANPTFQHILPMGSWADPGSDWISVPANGGPSAKAGWHRSPFPGDVEFSVEPKLLSTDSFRIALSVSNERAPNRDGYAFRYACEPDAGDGSPQSRVELLRAGKVVAAQMFFELPHQFSLRRCGHFIVGSINARSILTYRDEQLLSGHNVAYFAQHAEIPLETIRIDCPTVRDDFFSSAPVDWRSAGGAIAEVANRSQEDPRWSYFSLSNVLGGEKNALLWNKRKYPSDVCFEVHFGTRMQGERGQPYTYARDVNVSLCPDGSDLTRGYTFMWGAFGNQYTAILRNGVEVARWENKIPTDMNFHRHWFYYRVERHGSRLTFRVDRFFTQKTETGTTNEYVYDDPEPLACDRIALWTYSNGLAIGRIRLAGESRVGEAPGVPIAPLRVSIPETETSRDAKSQQIQLR